MTGDRLVILKPQSVGKSTAMATLQLPVRMRLSRAKGFNLQAASLALNGLPALNVSRPGLLGNPFVVGEDGDAAYCVDLHAHLCAGRLAVSARASAGSQHAAMTYLAENLKSFRKRNVACWCRLDAPCHGDTLLRLFKRRPACDLAQVPA